MEPLTGKKADADKPRMELLDASFLEGIARVLTFGAKKYEDHNWRKGLMTTRTIGACLRHIFAWLRGEDNDEETGENHLLHAACELMFTYWTVMHYKRRDDRWKETANQEITQ